MIKKFKEFLNEATNYDSLFLGKKISDIKDLISSLKYEGIRGLYNKTVVAMDSFASDTDAINYLKNNGYSVGTMQGDSPRGIKKGKFNIEKWRNLDQEDQDVLDGILIPIEKEYYILYFIFPDL